MVCEMISIKEIMKKHVPKLSSLDSVGSAIEVMEKMNVDYLLIEEESEIRGMVTSHGLVGYPSSRLILDCLIEPIGTISGEASPDEAIKIIEEKKVNFLVILNREAMPIGVVNREIIISALCQELKKSNKEKEEYITKLKKAEEELKKAYKELSDTHVQLVQAGKLAAMGEMAAGVVHELTQPLLGIKGFTTAMLEDMKRQLPTAECGPAPLDRSLSNGVKIAESKSEIEDAQFETAKRAVNDLEIVLQQINRMTKIVNMVRDFARASGTEMGLLDINKPIEDALLLFSEQLRLHNIVVEKNLAQGLPPVMGNANQLQQVFINLITNARDAMDAKGGEGRLTVSTEVSRTDGSVLIEFVDNGIGANAETVSRMFEPFFTTKTVGKGTGLGLSIVARIIEEHGGTIDVKSEPGQGCKFTIRLPIEN